MVILVANSTYKKKVARSSNLIAKAAALAVAGLRSRGVVRHFSCKFELATRSLVSGRKRSDAATEDEYMYKDTAPESCNVQQIFVVSRRRLEAECAERNVPSIGVGVRIKNRK